MVCQRRMAMFMQAELACRMHACTPCAAAPPPLDARAELQRKLAAMEELKQQLAAKEAEVARLKVCWLSVCVTACMVSRCPPCPALHRRMLARHGAQPP